MAYGIEELSEMKVTGPVEGGDMVAKPNEMPVGAAALLSKMQKKNTPGIFKLPQADKEMPSFMKVAAKGIEEQNTANLEDAEIMRIMGTYGVGPEEARRIYDEMIYGYERDEAAISPTDWRSILKMIESGMSQEEIDAQLAAAQFPGNFTDNPQNVKTLPTNLKTAPDHPETSLAYITDDEKALLAFMKPGTPHKGPEGVPTYDEGDYLTDIGYTKQEAKKYKDSTPQATQQQQQDFAEYVASQGGTSAYEQSGQADQAEIDKVKAGEKIVEDRTTQEYRDKMGMTADTINPYGFNFDVVPDWRKDVFPGQPGWPEKSMGDSGYAKNLDFINKQIEELEGLDELSSGDKKRLKELRDRRFNVLGGLTGEGERRPSIVEQEEKLKVSEDGEEEEESSFEKFLKSIGLGGKEIKGILPGSAQDKRIQELLAGFDRYEGDYKDSKAEMIKNLLGGKGQYYRDDGSLTLEGFKKAMRSIDMGADSASALESLKKFMPQEYYSKLGMPQTTGELENLAQNKTVDTSKLKRGTKEYEDAVKYNNQIFEARELTARDRGKNQNRGSGGAPITEVAETITENVDIDPRAGQFNVGGTMKYKDDTRTGGKEMDVPLGRRFAIDKSGKFRGNTPMGLNEAIKYATLGGYSQLEPFQEYLTRRRKELGEQPDEYFDEEGNVIYSGQA